MNAPLRPPTGVVALRALRGRCPACGDGHVMETLLRRAEVCTTCDWRFERGEGHWVGGSEICMIATFWIACIAFITLHRFVPISVVTMILAAATTVATTFVVYGRSRALFIALDFYIDPIADDDGDDDEERGGDPVRLPGRGPRRVAAAPLTR